jgi:gamma-D-glutamyl-L-lysine dipeptidyl-peptidase
MEYAFIRVPAAALRRKPGHPREMVNQLLFGEAVKILRTKNNQWVKVRSLHDEYEGWLTSTMLIAADKDAVKAKHPVVTTGLLESLIIGDEKMMIPAGSTLPFFEGGKGKLGELEFVFNGFSRDRYAQEPAAAWIIQMAGTWLHAPYLWGGRTILGVDCSGFVQVIYKQAGIDLPRDAWQQAQMGNPVKKLEDAQPGDLAFFDNQEDIVHTGILLGNGEIIHASGRVRIDDITSKGIINRETGKRTARLRAIRRVC